MKANELMIGDWVLYPDKTPQQILGIAPEITADGTTEDGFFNGCEWYPLKDAKPVPLTPEILEKNGLKKTQENQWVWERKYHSNVDIMFTNDIIVFYKEYPSEKNGGLQTGGWIQAMSERGRVDIEGEYVHELQRAVRQCKIDKEIIL